MSVWGTEHLHKISLVITYSNLIKAYLTKLTSKVQIVAPCNERWKKQGDWRQWLWTSEKLQSSIKILIYTVVNIQDIFQ